MSSAAPLRVLALVTLPTLGASNRLRVEQYASALRARGILLEVSPFLDDAAYRILYAPGATARKAIAVARGMLRRIRDLRRAAAYDLVLVHRESAPVGPPLVERWLVGRKRPYAFDFDDALFLRPVHPANRRWGWLRQPSRLAYAVAEAAEVIAGNEYLARWARGRNPRVTVIPTPVDVARHVPRPPHRDTAPLVIGWVGSSTTAPYLRILDAPLAEIGRRRDVVLRVIGGTYRHPTVAVDARPYDLDREPADIATFDIGVLPEPDDEWTKGKGAFKALLYMASAVPVVASRVGVNPEIIVEGETGYCVDDERGWVRRLEELAADPGARDRLGRCGRERVERHFSIGSQAPRLADVLVRAAAAR